MPTAAPRATRNERALQFLQRTGLRKGILGASRGWTYAFVGAVVLRRVRKAIGSEPEVVYRGELKPGESFLIGHLTETYSGKRVRSRRRRIVDNT